MRITASTLLVGALVSVATALARPGFQFPDAVPLAKRQTSGPSYECHASCGHAIQDSAKDGYCRDQSWVKLLDDCLDCALKYQIWQWYGNKVGAAARQCGLDATPKPVEGGASSHVESATTAPGSTPVATGTWQTGGAPGQTTSAESRPSSGSVPPTSVVSRTSAGQTTGAPTVTAGRNATASHSSTVTAGASRNTLSGLVVAAAAALFAAYML
ncbi:hypothetical protein ED733_003695 [Metarhizium rileyi]|uniref:Uncharacterized protein n=1 Tax=Metarhizium rileyi (strain RCEF 4871) TaxID=1649241 RepID=A0A5C6GC02_METRR|nr:hypothetical protein ED733_003695 [Metarhizium rileyi]